MRTFIVSHRGTDAGLFWAKPRHADVSPSAEVQNPPANGTREWAVPPYGVIFDRLG
jgi:hypothetical protein